MKPMPEKHVCRGCGRRDTAARSQLCKACSFPVHQNDNAITDEEYIRERGDEMTHTDRVGVCRASFGPEPEDPIEISSELY